jgi:hypothetical protein
VETSSLRLRLIRGWASPFGASRIDRLAFGGRQIARARLTNLNVGFQKG